MKTIESRVLMPDGSTKKIVAKVLSTQLPTQAERDKAVADQFATSLARQHKKANPATPAVDKK